ncbi:hypothetical protein MSG28_006190 [Choristoneura fumiferana]|uniref:Uncharacterized protein n=1 Tax=Choristoneura fumiferana TaxID=7141 RepID=A0ACC0JDY0_CHOFU|nr:hypothetical protein MSG28_006190 [Choristoneura fumiferana]
MDLDYRILNLYKTKQYNECLTLCATALQGRDDRMIEFIQMRAMTIQAKVAGTARARTARSALNTASRASRAATALGGAPFTFTPSVPLSLRFVDKDDKLFAPAAKTLFEYVFYCEGDVRKAIDLAFQAQKLDDTLDWWWNFSLARCYYTLGMYRNTEDCLRQALKLNKHITIYLRLIAMYVGLNQPLSALEVCKQGLLVFHEYTPLLLEQARIHDQMGNSTLAVKEYRMEAVGNESTRC